MKCRRIFGENHRYWNIKGRRHYVGFFRLNFLWVLEFVRHQIEQTVVPQWHRSRKG
jgi:hypothetical protein